jgi:predicted GIY-YIG superfamily endonuclease
MPYYLYELVSPIDNQCFYIGITGNPRRRFQQHLAGKCASTKGFISELSGRGLKPLHVPVFEFASLVQAHELEKTLVRESIRSKTPLCNNRFGRVHHSSMSNHGAAWGDDDRRRVSDMHRSGANAAEIALALGRSRSSIRWALRRLGLTESTLVETKAFKRSVPDRADNHATSSI